MQSAYRGMGALLPLLLWTSVAKGEDLITLTLTGPDTVIVGESTTLEVRMSFMNRRPLVVLAYRLEDAAAGADDGPTPGHLGFTGAHGGSQLANPRYGGGSASGQLAEVQVREFGDESAPLNDNNGQVYLVDVITLTGQEPGVYDVQFNNNPLVGPFWLDSSAISHYFNIDPDTGEFAFDPPIRLTVLEGPGQENENTNSNGNSNSNSNANSNANANANANSNDNSDSPPPGDANDNVTVNDNADPGFNGNDNGNDGAEANDNTNESNDNDGGEVDMNANDNVDPGRNDNGRGDQDNDNDNPPDNSDLGSNDNQPGSMDNGSDGGGPITPEPSENGNDNQAEGTPRRPGLCGSGSMAAVLMSLCGLLLVRKRDEDDVRARSG